MAGKTKTLLLALSRPEMIRIVLNTETYETLRRQPDLKIVILAPSPDDPELVRNFGGPNVSFEKLEARALRAAQRGSRLKYALSAVRLFTYNRRRVPGPMAVDYILKEQRENASKGRRDLLARLYYGTIYRLPGLLGRSRWLRRLWVAMESRVIRSDLHSDVYERHRPDLVITSSIGYGPDMYLMNEARRHGASILGIVKSWDNPMTKGYPGAPVDVVAAWSGVMRDDLYNFLDIPKDRVVICGVPYWDDYFRPVDIGTREAFLTQIGLRPDRRTIYYATSMPQLYKENAGVGRLLAEAIRDGRIPGPVQLLVRPHPGHWQTGKSNWEQVAQADLEDFRALEREFDDFVRIDWPDLERHGDQVSMSGREGVNLRQKFTFCDVMVANYSTQAIEAAVFDLPIVNIAFGNYKRSSLPNSIVDNFAHYRRVLATGALTNCYDPDEMIEGVKAYLADRSLHAEGRRRLLDQEIPANRGKAGRVVGEVVLRALGLELTDDRRQDAAE